MLFYTCSSVTECSKLTIVSILMYMLQCSVDIIFKISSIMLVQLIAFDLILWTNVLV